jgi:hypothetical protein
MATPTSGRTHTVSPDALPLRNAARRPAEMPYFRVVDDSDDDRRVIDEAPQPVSVQRRITRAFTSDVRIDHRSPDARESAA